MKRNIKNLASAFIVAGALIVTPVIAQAQSTIYLPFVASPPIAMPVVDDMPEEPTVGDTVDSTVTVGYTSATLVVIPQTTLGKAIDYVDHAGLATQHNWTPITGDLQEDMGVDQFSAHTYTTGVKDTPCIQIRVRKALTTISAQACYKAIESNLYVQYHDVWTLVNVIATTIQ